MVFGVLAIRFLAVPEGAVRTALAAPAREEVRALRVLVVYPSHGGLRGGGPQRRQRERKRGSRGPQRRQRETPWAKHVTVGGLVM